MLQYGQQSVGIDISDQTIEVAEILSGFRKKITSLGQRKLPTGLVERGRIKDVKALTKELDACFKQAKPKPINYRRAVFSLPESQVYTHDFILKEANKKKWEDLIKQEALANFPIPENDLVYAYTILTHNKQGATVLLAASSYQVINEWRAFFRQAKIRVDYFAVEALAIFRGLFVGGVKEPVAIIDLGAYTTLISIFDKHGLEFTYSVNTAGNRLNSEIAKALNIGQDQAEKMKIKLGLTDPDSQVFNVILKTLEKITRGIDVSVDYYQNKSGQQIKKAVLIGGTSRLKGLLEYFQSNLEYEVQLGSSKLFKTHKLDLGYIEAIGLANIGLKEKWLKKDPVFVLKDVKKPSKKSKSSGKKAGKKTRDVESMSSEYYTLEDQEIEFEAKKLRRQQITFLIIVIIGAIAISLAFWYQNEQKKKKAQEYEQQLETFLEDRQREIQYNIEQ